MKNKILTVFIALLIISCNKDKKKSVEAVLESNNLEEIRAKRAELATQQQEIDDKLTLLDEKITALDTVKHVPLITTITVQEQLFEHFLELQGNVTTKNLLVLYPEFSGILSKVYVKEGQAVSNGQLLAKVDDGGLSQQKAQMEIQAALAKTTFERQERLWKENIGSEIQYLQAKSNYEAQAKAINQLRKQIAKTEIRAPFSGTIDEVITEEGNVVSAGQTPVMRIVNLRNMYVETEVPERYINDVTKNKAVKINIPVLGKTIDSKVRQTADYINPNNRTFKVEIAVPNTEKSIKPNLTAKLRINDYTSEDAFLIPQSVISENADGEQYIYIVKDINENGEGTAERKIIETGRTQGDIIEVLSGIKNGDHIINEGARSVKDGQAVKILEVDDRASEAGNRSADSIQ